MWLIVLLLIARVTGALFIFSGVSKLMARAAFVASLHALPFVPLWSVAGVSTILPWVEIGVGSALVMGLLVPYVGGAALALLLVFTLVAIMAVVRGLDVPCSCFGATSGAPLSRRTVARNGLFALLLLPLVMTNRPSPVSLDALRSRSGGPSLMDVILMILLPVCLAIVAVTIVAAQHTLEQLSPR